MPANHLLSFQRQKNCKDDGCNSLHFVRFQLALAWEQLLDFCFSSPVSDGRNGVPLSCPKCVLFLLLMDQIQYTFFLMFIIYTQSFIQIALTGKKLIANICKFLFPAECFVYLLETCRWYPTQKMGEASLYIRGYSPKGFLNVHRCLYVWWNLH